MERTPDEIRFEIRQLIHFRNQVGDWTPDGIEAQRHLNTLLWVVGAVDQTPTESIEKRRLAKLGLD